MLSGARARVRMYRSRAAREGMPPTHSLAARLASPRPILSILLFVQTNSSRCAPRNATGYCADSSALMAATVATTAPLEQFRATQDK